MSRRTQAVVLFLLGMLVLHAALSDLYLRYVKAGLRPLLLAGGAVLILAAVTTVWYEWRAKGKETHQHREPAVTWLLVLPVLALLLLSPPALGSYTANRTGTGLKPPLTGFDPLPAGNPVPLTVADYARRAVYQHGRPLEGKQVVVTGFLTVDEGGRPYLTRMVVNCCAADAQPVKIGLTGSVPPVLEPDLWLQVTGTYTSEQTRDPINDGIIPYLTVTRTTRVKAPSDPYET